MRGGKMSCTRGFSIQDEAALRRVPPHTFHAVGASLRPFELGRFLDEAELRQGCDAVVEADFLDDFAILKPQHGRSRERHLAAGVGRQASDQEVIESGTGMRSASRPTTDDVVALRDEVGCAPEVEIRERLPEVGHERLDVIATAAGFVQRIVQQHVGRGQFVDNAEIAGLAPEMREPSTHDGLVVFFLRHVSISLFVPICHRKHQASGVDARQTTSQQRSVSCRGIQIVGRQRCGASYLQELSIREPFAGDLHRPMRKRLASTI
jgi:hypothetical protein